MTGAWTPERVARLVELWPGKLTAEEIADELGEVSRCAVIGRAWRMKLPSREHRAGFNHSARGRKVAVAAPTFRPPKPAGAALPFRPKPKLVKPMPEPCSLELLDEVNDCRYPVQDKPFLYCGAARLYPGLDQASTYCAVHHKLAHTGSKQPTTAVQMTGDRFARPFG